ncbi:MAG TPA: methyltransferase domain-containing protein [Caulobacterales bacterium]|nr:methyltransferase domain-containing protein [Caulobacterales bacterium]
MPAWDPTLYLKFGAERTRPAADLLARVNVEAPRFVVDLGCGPGNSTALLRARYADADILGVDSSADMLADAAGSGVAARWRQGDFDTWSPETPPDLIYANAAFQWSDAPVALVTRLFRTLASGGALAFQVPQNFDQPSHVQVRAAVDTGGWAEKLKGARQYDPGFARAADYARALMPLGARLDIWTSEYLHILDGPDPVFRWMSGTGLRPFVQALDGADRAAFEAAVRERLARAYPAEADGRTLFPFRRLFVIAAA